MAQHNGDNNEFGIREYLEIRFNSLDEKIDIVSKKQDLTNGKVSRHESEIKVLVDHDRDLKRLVIGIAIVVIGGVLLALAKGAL